jgi:DNA-binding MarR family transcriptional regulator
MDMGTATPISAAGRAKRSDPAAEAWRAVFDLFTSERPPRFPAVAQRFGLSPQQLHLLRNLAPGVEQPMSALADLLFCDPSNVTGIVDRLESRGLIERRPHPADRRVKRIAITDHGAEVRAEAMRLIYEPPEAIKRLSRAEQRELRDLARKALALADGAPPAGAAAAPPSGA